ncbi:FlgM family anti-sigma-28 factor [Enterobacter sp. BIGb0383]|nr:FlgM family anti-sigma-28 factor [Enterobacter sp. BIGb0383]ROS06816.1 FlgM family anti-sigma-28 factor [Enterobacter sp. BIGb0359]
MSIERTQQISPATLSEIHQDSTRRANRNISRPASDASTPRNGTKVSLGNHIQALKTDDSQDINIERLDKIKAALAAGDLPIDTDKIAASLTQDIFQLR